MSRTKLACLLLSIGLALWAARCGSDEGGPSLPDADADIEVVPETADDVPVEEQPDVPETQDPDLDAVDVPDTEGDVETDGTVEVVWDVAVVDDVPGFKSRVAIALDAAGNVHLAYNIATDPEGWYTPSVWYATNESGSWAKVEAAPAAGVSNEFPVIVVDAAGKPHIFYNRYIEAEGQIDVFHLTTDDGGTFQAPQNITAALDDEAYAPSAFIEGDDTIHLVFQTRTGVSPDYVYGIGYATVSGGAVSAIEEVASSSAMPSLDPTHDIVVDGSGNVHVVYGMPGETGYEGVLNYRGKTGSAWGAPEALSETNMDVYGTCLGIDGAGVIHLAYVKGELFGDMSLMYNSREGGSWSAAQALGTFPDDRSYYLGLAGENGGEGVHIAFKRYYDSNGDIFYLRGQGGAFDEPYRVTETADLDEGTPAIALAADGTVYIAFTENLSDAPNGVIYLATRREITTP
jgi:hypothetical protein